MALQTRVCLQTNLHHLQATSAYIHGHEREQARRAGGDRALLLCGFIIPCVLKQAGHIPGGQSNTVGHCCYASFPSLCRPLCLSGGSQGACRGSRTGWSDVVRHINSPKAESHLLAPNPSEPLKRGPPCFIRTKFNLSQTEIFKFAPGK